MLQVGQVTGSLSFIHSKICGVRGFRNFFFDFFCMWFALFFVKF
jgi:hypothetical protein